MSHINNYISKMIDDIKAHGFKNEAILEAIKKVPRHKFMPEGTPLDLSYEDCNLPIGEGQNILQPCITAYMLSLLHLSNGLNVLEIGTGSGWNAALIKTLVGIKGKVSTIEIFTSLTRIARKHLLENNFNVEILNHDGSEGYKKNAPYDRIIVTCSIHQIMGTWLNQLKLGGIIIAPVGIYKHVLTKGVKRIKGLKIEKCGNFIFSPLLYEHEI